MTLSHIYNPSLKWKKHPVWFLYWRSWQSPNLLTINLADFKSRVRKVMGRHVSPRQSILTLCSLHTVHHLHAAQRLIILHDSATDTDRGGNISKHTLHCMDCWQTGVAPPNLTSVDCAVIPVPLVHLRLSVKLQLTPPSEIFFDPGVVDVSNI